MAAGDVVILAEEPVSGSGLQCVVAKVTLDGGNPTPVDLTPFFASIFSAVATLAGTATPGVGAANRPSICQCNVNGLVVDVYAFAPTSNADPTPIASTNNATDVNVTVWGRRKLTI